MDVLQQPKADQSGEHGGTTIGDKGQGNACHRHQPHGHPNIFKGLKRKPSDHPNAYQPAKEIIGSLGDQKGPPEEEAKEGQH